MAAEGNVQTNKTNKQTKVCGPLGPGGVGLRRLHGAQEEAEHGGEQRVRRLVEKLGGEDAPDEEVVA